ncbi:hypothetical protein ATO6_20440 [Oceanicola sp. 22II-s10i]|uniref:TRAP transporter small permease subunit n=1 Tax=Oceanicola sp. 22II-s10i TaxID=1317116 RepID=UPI000B52731B|nr:TRAP transporter small permease [Oceanicola sp. 22II-s10i]OWU83208.1 hypothetical protein ATO6_20440 [Oceanicola sp. 22II-s10i]
MVEDTPQAGRRGAASRFIALTDRLSIAASVLSALALFLIALIVCYEVTSRYLFNSPTIWAWDINVQLMLTLIMLGLANVHRQNKNIAVDVLTEQLSVRTRAALGVIFGLFLIFIAGVILYFGWFYFHQSFSRGQTAPSLFAPPLWPVKFMLPLGAGILLLQAIARILQDLDMLRTPARATDGPAAR